MNSQREEIEQYKGCTLGCLFSLYLLLAIGIGITMFFSYFRSFTFKPVDGVITKSEMVPCSGEASGTFHDEIRFKYVVNGKTYYDGQLRNHFAKICDQREVVEELVQQYPVGTKVDAWYDPTTPATAVIDRSLNIVQKIFALVIAALGMIFGIAYYAQSKEKTTS